MKILLEFNEKRQEFHYNDMKGGGGTMGTLSITECEEDDALKFAHLIYAVKLLGFLPKKATTKQIQAIAYCYFNHDTPMEDITNWVCEMEPERFS